MQPKTYIEIKYCLSFFVDLYHNEGASVVPSFLLYYFVQILSQLVDVFDWGLIAILNNTIAEKKAPLSQIKVLAFKEKGEWDLQAKYNIGKKVDDKKKKEEPVPTTSPSTDE